MPKTIYILYENNPFCMGAPKMRLFRNEKLRDQAALASAKAGNSISVAEQLLEDD
jgi:hypothetical protein